MDTSKRPGPGATIYSVAERAGVSIATVSRTLHGSTVVSATAQKKVLAAVDELNYVAQSAARSLAVRHYEALGLVLPELSGPYYSELLMGFESRAGELGLSVVLVLADGKQDLVRAAGRLATRVDGLAVLGSASIPDAVVTSLQGKKPVLLIAGDPTTGVETVGAENAHSAELLTAHLITHGRKHLLFIGDPDLAPDVRERYCGFVAAHRAPSGRTAAKPVRISFRESEGAAVADRLVVGELDADALVCANDELALSIMHRLQEHGRDVPGEFAVVGWDDVMAARYVCPGLTTVRQPVRELGVRAAERLSRLATGAPPRRTTKTLPTELVLRGSCGCTEATTRHTNEPALA